jgi:hypothetical protein
MTAGEMLDLQENKRRHKTASSIPGLPGSENSWENNGDYPKQSGELNAFGAENYMIF